MKFYAVKPKPYIKQRIIATLIDYAIFFCVTFLLIYTLGRQTSDGSWVLEGPMALVIPLLWFLYFIVTEVINQATPGHDIVKLKVFSCDGYKPPLSAIIKRRICDAIDIGIYGIPALICINKTLLHQRIGDIWAGTVVVKLSDIEEQEVTF